MGGYINAMKAEGTLDKHNIEDIFHADIRIDPKLLDEEITDPEVKTLVKVSSQPKHWDGVTAESVMGCIRDKYGKAQIGDLDIYHLRGLDELIRTMRIGPGVWKRFVGTGDEPARWFTKGSVFQFAPTVGDNQRMHDMYLFPNTIINKDGSINDNARPLKHWNTEKQMMEQVYAQTHTPLSHFNRMVELRMNADKHMLQAKDIQRKRLTRAPRTRIPS